MGLRSSKLLTALAVASLVLASAGGAWAQGRSFGDVLLGRPQQSAAPPPAVGRYGNEKGLGFVLDLSGAWPLLRYEDSDEVWVLQPKAVGRGDTVYTNDAGDTVLRATRQGGLIMYTEDRPQGVAVSFRGGAAPIPPDVSMSAQQFVRLMQSAALRLNRALRHDATIKFDATNLSGPLIGEAANLVMASIEEVAADAPRSPGLSRLARVALKEGPAPSVSFDQGVLTITVTPSLGVAGRPSSEKIERALKQ